MRKTIIIQDDRIDILKDGYNIIEKTIYGENIPEILAYALDRATDDLDMDNLDAVNVLQQLKELLQGEN